MISHALFGGTSATARRKSLSPYVSTLTGAGAAEYAIGGYDFLRGFLSGLHAGNFDITHIFIDNLYKLSQTKDPQQTEAFLDWCSVFSAENGVAFTLTIAGDPAEAPEFITRLMD